MPNVTPRTLPSGRHVATVNRDQLRFRSHGRRFEMSTLSGLLDLSPRVTVPVSWDFSRSEKLTFPIDGNDQYGDCYYAAVAHGSNCFTGNAGNECSFDVNALVKRYLQISGGDNGLSDQDIMPEWKSGIIGPNGPRKILDEMVVTAAPGSADWLEAFYCGGGLIWTCSLLDTWLNNDNSGSLWDAGGRPDPSAGHAMFLTGRRPDGTTDTRTWGITPPIHVTDAGFNAAQSEFIVVFSADQFNPQSGLCVFSGMDWETKRSWWKARGGADVGPSPFGPTPAPPVPPTPPVPPVPVPPSPPVPPVPMTYSVTIPDQVLSVPHLLGHVNVTWKGGTYQCVPGTSAPGVLPWAQILALLAQYGAKLLPVILADIAAKKTLQQIVADCLAALFGG